MDDRRLNEEKPRKKSRKSAHLSRVHHVVPDPERYYSMAAKAAETEDVVVLGTPVKVSLLSSSLHDPNPLDIR